MARAHRARLLRAPECTQAQTGTHKTAASLLYYHPPFVLDYASSMSLFNFNPCHHCTPNQCTIHQTKSQRSYKWSRIERVHSQVPTMTYAFLAFIAFIAFLGAAAAAFAAFLAMLLSTEKD